MIFLWIKIVHVVSIISWMAGLLYLPRLFVYHAQAHTGKDLSETFKIMERRLLKVIMNPAMILAWITGLALGFMLGQFSADIEIWFILKLLLVLGLTTFHMFLGHWRRDFERDQNKRSEKFYRRINEVPTVLMIGIVIMVILRPF